MCSELCKDFYVVYQLEMVAGEVESSCQLVATFFFFFGLTLPNYRNKSGSAQPPLISTTCSAAACEFKTHGSVSCGPRSRRVTPVSILTGRKKTQFSHLRSSVLP